MRLEWATTSISAIATACARRYPIEMAGLTEFPRIGEQPYFLTLGPYAFYWFTLQQTPLKMSQMPARSRSEDPNAIAVDALPALLVGGDWQTILDSSAR